MDMLIDSALNEEPKKQKQEIKVAGGKGTTSDEELMAILQDSLTKIRIIGTGGSGNNTLRRIERLLY